MAKLSKSDAAKAAGVSRQTLYTYIKDGRVGVDPDGLIDTAELLRAGFALHEVGRQSAEPIGQYLTSTTDTVDVYREMLVLLRQQLAEAQAREQAALERERATRDREALLLQMLQETQHRYDRLLEAPRAAPPAATAPRPVAPASTRAPAHRIRPGRPTPTMPATWQRILGYMREQHTPLRAADIEQALGVPQARMVLKRMCDAEVIVRVAKGVYAVTRAEEGA